MALHTQRFHKSQLLVLHTNGALGLGASRTFYDLVGKTLTLTKPTAGACTFIAGADSRGLRLGEVNEQLASSAISDVHVVVVDGMAFLVENEPRYGIGLSASAQTARTALGILASGAISTSVMGPKGSGKVPSIVDIFPSGHELTLIWTDETYGSSAPSSGGTSITDPSAGHTLLSTPSRAIYVGGNGDLTVHRYNDAAGTYTTYTGLKAGDMLPVVADEIRSSTTATLLVIEQQ